MSWFIERPEHLTKELIELSEKIVKLENSVDKDTEELSKLKEKLNWLAHGKYKV